MFLDKTHYSHRASLQPSVQMGTGQFNAGGNPAMDSIPCRMEGNYSSYAGGRRITHPMQEGGEVLLFASCYLNWDTLRRDRALY